jgi:Zn finger protein HypA/HybF involved in hydrogenase expression
MYQIECPHCGTESEITEDDEEPTCELCDGHLDEWVEDDED